jgi:drug/metabolite transporter (DMT)-like permease
MKPRERLGLFQGIFSVILLSLASVSSKFLLDYISPELLILLQECMAVITILLLFGLSLEIKKVLKFKKKTITVLIIFSLLTGALAPFLMLKGLLITTATDAILIASMTGVVTGVLASIFLKDKISVEKILGIIFMFTGVIIIATKGLENGLNVGTGYYFLLGGVLSISIATILFKKFLIHISTDIIVLSRNFGGILCMLLLIPFFVKVNYEIDVIFKETELMLILISYAIFILLTADFLWYKSLEKIKVSTSALLVFLKPLFGVIFAIIILKEVFDKFHVIGGALIIIGLLFSTIHHEEHNIQKNYKKHYWLPHWFHL